MEASSLDSKVAAAVAASPIPVADVLADLSAVAALNPAAIEKNLGTLIEAVEKAKDFQGAVACLRAAGRWFPAYPRVKARDTLCRAASTRSQLAFIEHAGIMTTASLIDALNRLDALAGFKPGDLVFNKSWGFGIIKKIDDFYAKITVDFTEKSNYILPFAVAGEQLMSAPADHIMTRFHKDRDAVLTAAADEPGEVLKQLIRSYGPMTIARIEALLDQTGIVPKSKWKAFWSGARSALKSDRKIVIPLKRTESVRILDREQGHDAVWFEALRTCRDPKKIYADVCAYLAESEDAPLADEVLETIENRVRFAILGAYKTDPALYAQTVLLLNRLRKTDESGAIISVATAEDRDAACEHLLDEDRFLVAAQHLAARDIHGMLDFLVHHSSEAPARIRAVLDQMTSVCLSEALAVMKADAETGAEVRRLLKDANSAPTLLVWALRNREAAEAWQAPGLFELLMQAVHVIEQKHTGEALRMRNTLQQFFDSPKWLEETMKQLKPFERSVVFERVQAAAAWETSSQRSTLNRMIRHDNDLAKSRKVLASETQLEHYTSWRSLAEYRNQYEKLVRVDMPKNAQDIAAARSYGDLRENFEYQAAKDHQRVLLNRQAEMDLELKTMKGTDFADVKTDVAMPGTQITLKMEDGKIREFTILGEWDRNEKLNIISNKSRLALSVLGKPAGTTVLVPSALGELQATLEKVEPLSDAVRTWLSTEPPSVKE